MKRSCELRQERQELMDRTGVMLDLITKERRTFSTQEQAEFDSDLDKVRRLQLEITGAEEDEAEEKRAFAEGRSPQTRRDGPRVPRESQTDDPPTFAITTDGKSVRMLSPSESLRSITQNDLPDNARASEFSWGRALRGAVLGDWKGGDLERRALSEGLGVGGGYLVPETLAAEFIDLARNQSVIFRAGARTLPMPTPEVTIARLTSDPTAYFVAEGVEITADATMAFGAHVLRAKKLACLLNMSLEVVEDASNLDSIIRNAISQAMALKLDYSILRGVGGSNDIQGLITWVGVTGGVQIVEPGGNGAALADYDDFLDCIGKVQTANGEARTVIYAPRTATALAKLKEATTLATLAPPPQFDALEKLVSNQIPITGAYGTSNVASEAWLGDFRTLLVGIRTEMNIEISRVAGDNFKKGLVTLRAYTRADFTPLRPTHICQFAGIIP